MLRDVPIPARVRIGGVDDEFAFEVYAEGVGVSIRYERDLETQLNFDIDPVASNIRSGHEFYWEVIDYGVE